MKKFLTFFVATFFGCMPMFGEFYFPLNQEWKFLTESYCEGGMDKKIEVNAFGDAIEIAGVTYYPFQGSYLRSKGNKVLYHVSDEMPDVVLYDFDVQVGDSLMFFQDGLPSSMLDPENTTYSVVTKVDTVTLMDKRQARRIHYDNRADDIEYMGSVYGLLEPLRMPIPTCMNISLLCVSVDNEPIYETSVGACDIELKDTVELKGEYREFDSLLWEGEIVFPGVDPGIKTEDGKEYYLFYNDMFPCMLTEGDPIRVKAAVSEEHDLRGVPYNKAEVLEWIDYPGKYIDEYGSQIVPLYFTDVNGNMDTIHLGINPSASHFLNPEFGESAIPEEKLDSAMQSPHFVLVKVDEEGDDYDEICKWGQHKAVVDVADDEYDAFRFAIAADRFPIRVSWDTEAIATDFSHSFLTDWNLGGWFDCGGGKRFGMMQQTECVFNTQEYHLCDPGSEEHDYDYPRWPNVNIPFCMVYARISGKKWTASLPSASANDNCARKYLSDGQIVIDVNGVRYDVLGKMLK